MIPLILIVFGVALVIGLVRKATAIEWIWLLFGAAITLVVLWVLLIVFVVGPEMQRTGIPGTKMK